MWTRLAMLGLILCGAGCGSQPQASTSATPSQPRTNSPTAAPSLPPGGGPPAPVITVTSVGGASGPTGLVAVAVVKDGSAEAAAGVTVTFSAQTGGGGQPITAIGHLAQLRPGEIQAVTASLTIPAGLAVTHLAATAQAVGAPAPAAPPLSVDAPKFQSSGYATSVSIVAVNSGPAPIPAEIVIVCRDDRALIMGGGAVGPLNIASGTSPQTVPVAVTDVPARCEGYIHPG